MGIRRRTGWRGGKQGQDVHTPMRGTEECEVTPQLMAGRATWLTLGTAGPGAGLPLGRS